MRTLLSQTLASLALPAAVVACAALTARASDFAVTSSTSGQYEVFGTTEPDDIDYMAGNAWHYPANTEPYASKTMRTPLEVALGDHPYVRLGVNPTTGDDAPTKVQLK